MIKFYFLFTLLMAMNGRAAIEVSHKILEVDCATLSLVSTGTTIQSLCINTPITPIAFVVGNGGTGAVVTGLPNGVSGVYDAGSATFTLSGVPTLAGTFAYVVTTIGGDCATSLDGTITVNPNAMIRLSSASDSANAMYCVHSPITNLRYVLSQGATGAFISSGVLPLGVTANLVNNNYRITGVPTVTGTYPYSITTTGGCGSQTRSGVIRVVDEAIIEMVSPVESLTQSICAWGYIEPIKFHAPDNDGVIVLNVSPQAPQISLNPDSQGNYVIDFELFTEPGIYTFEVGVIQGYCGNPSITGTIEAKPRPVTMSFYSEYTDNTFTTLYHNWHDVIGATSYEYTYAIDNGPVIYGTTIPPVSEMYVTGLVPGQSVHFTYYPVGPFCFSSMSGTHSSTPLAAVEFDSKAFNYFPNPIDDVLNLKYSHPVTRVEIFNLVGQQVFASDYSLEQIQINTSGFNQGVYVVRVTSEEIVHVVKVLKN